MHPILNIPLCDFCICIFAAAVLKELNSSETDKELLKACKTVLWMLDVDDGSHTKSVWQRAKSAKRLAKVFVFSPEDMSASPGELEYISPCSSCPSGVGPQDHPPPTFQVVKIFPKLVKNVINLPTFSRFCNLFIFNKKCSQNVFQCLKLKEFILERGAGG